VTERNESDGVMSEQEEKEYTRVKRWIGKSPHKVILTTDFKQYLTDSYVAVAISQNILNRLSDEYGEGVISNTKMPQHITQMLDNADTLITSPPAEATMNGKPVYVFNFDGKTNHIFDKKPLNVIDGNFLYVGNFDRQHKFIKAVDADGEVVGFCLPIRSGVVENIKPSKMRSFSKAMMTKIAQMQTETTTKSKKSPSAMDIKQNAAIHSKAPLDNSTAQEYNQISDAETSAIMAYKSGASYNLNAKLRGDISLNEYEQSIAKNLDNALEKLPTYKGKVYRNISFDGFGDKAARDAFVAGHVVDDLVWYKAYTSTSTAIDGYVLEGDFVVHIVIESINGRNMEGYGNNSESEVLLSRNSRLITNSIEYDQNGTPTIYLTEVANEQQAAETQTANRRGTERNDSRDHSREPGSRTHTADTTEVQRLSAQNSGNSEMQSPLSGMDTGGNIRQGKMPRVQAEITPDDSKTKVRENEMGENTATDKQKRRTSSPDSEWDVQAVRENYEEYAASLQDITDVISQLFDVHISVRNVGKDASGKKFLRTRAACKMRLGVV